MSKKEFDTVLIDADQLPYAIGAKAVGEPLSYALSTVKNSLDRIQKQCNAENRELWIKGKGNFREEIAVARGYKSHRKTEKPAHFEDIYQYLIEFQGANEAHGMEADDMLSVRLYEDHLGDTENFVLSSQDKDLINTPGWHFNPRKPEYGVQYVSPEESFVHFWWQMLAGDTADNIPGLPNVTPRARALYSLRSTKGVGSKSGWEIVHATEIEDLPRTVYNLYHEWFKHDNPAMPEEFRVEFVDNYFTEQAKLLWMVRELHADGSPVHFNKEWFDI